MGGRTQAPGLSCEWWGDGETCAGQGKNCDGINHGISPCRRVRTARHFGKSCVATPHMLSRGTAILLKSDEWKEERIQPRAPIYFCELKKAQDLS